MTMQNPIFTIGHSTHSQAHFLALLHKHRVTALCDVRSRPYSRMNPQFNRAELKPVLLSQGIQYRFLGEELGARSDDASCYNDGKVQYALLAKTEPFQRGLKQLLRGVKEGFRVTLMCAEKEPLECHRTILVARQLVALGTEVFHIHADGHLESHAAALNRLAEMLRIPESDLFRTREELLAEAYERQERRIAYDAAREDVAPMPLGMAI